MAECVIQNYVGEPIQNYAGVTVSEDLKFNDEFITDMGEKIQERCEEIQEAVNRYIDILGKVTATAITSGDTSDALKEFRDSAKKMKKVIQDFGVEENGMALHFLSEINTEDHKFFKG